jgi:hypothetical protein
MPAEALTLHEGRRLERLPDGLLDGCKRFLDRSVERSIPGKVDNAREISCHSSLRHTGRY